MKTSRLIPVVAASSLALGLATTTVHADDQRSDVWSEASLTTSYTLNQHLNPFDIDVDVNNGTAILTGTVESDIERDLAEEIAMGIDGISKVDNRLVTEPDAERKSGKGSKDFMESVNDANITAKVKSQLLWNSNTQGMQIDVDTDSQVVTLKGKVNSSTESELAEQVARNTDGVRDVHNRLQVNKDSSAGTSPDTEPSDARQKVSDTWITTKVKSSLIYNRSINADEIDVEVKGGVVQLDGTVSSELEKETAITIAEDIRGVKDVNDSLQVAAKSSAARE